MRSRKHSGLGSQAGFSMIEMLMTAFILAIGLLGLCMLQTMSLRGSRGSRSLTTAVHVATAVLDQVDMQGRISWLNVIADGTGALKNQTNANLGPAYLNYILLGAGNDNSAKPQTFNIQGNPVDANSPDPTMSNPFFTAVTKYLDDVGNAGGTGQVSDFSVTVTFTDNVNANNQPKPRTVVLTRRITHG